MLGAFGVYNESSNEEPDRNAYKLLLVMRSRRKIMYQELTNSGFNHCQSKGGSLCPCLVIRGKHAVACLDTQPSWHKIEHLSSYVKHMAISKKKKE